jgi:D-alanyl-D-alanine carboxypeptidase
VRGRIVAAARTALTGIVAAGMPAASANAATGPDHTADVVKERLERLVKDDHFPAALAAVQDAKGRTRTRNAVTDDGRAATVAVTAMPTSIATPAGK